eukprot:6064342-Pleurochrysis_carterae.AAC.1
MDVLGVSKWMVVLDVSEWIDVLDAGMQNKRGALLEAAVALPCKAPRTAAITGDRYCGPEPEEAPQRTGQQRCVTAPPPPDVTPASLECTNRDAWFRIVGGVPGQRAPRQRASRTMRCQWPNSQPLCYTSALAAANKQQAPSVITKCLLRRSQAG